MNCYGTNPIVTQPVQSVNAMNTYTNPMNYQTTTVGAWGQQTPVDPNLATSPISIYPQTPATTLPATDLPTTMTSSIYTPGYLMTQIGALMRVEFLIGDNTTDRVGRLKQVGSSFIILEALDGGSEIMCDIYSIKFVTIIQNSTSAALLASFPSV